MITQIRLMIVFLLLGSYSQANESSFIIADKNVTSTFYLSDLSDDLLFWAVNDLADDIKLITGVRPNVVKTNVFLNNGEGSGIYIGLFDDVLIRSCQLVQTNELNGIWEKYIIIPAGNNLFIAGSDIRGTVYGLFDLAEQLGISPWKWWADVQPAKQQTLKLKLPAEGITSSPSVQYRGIFLNDEDWGLQPWAAHTFDPEVGNIGPKTYEKIFQLLLRLKANTIWPAMHDCTRAFFTIPGNREMALKYHIVVGTSHAEPMLRNNVDEWKTNVRGAFNYFNNSNEVNKYWEERIKQVSDSTNQVMVTVGMRGIHDSKMEGEATAAKQVEILETIITNQRNMLEQILGKPAGEILQVLVPYKEVLDLYNAGLQIPEDITLMWTDDNYGFIRRLSNEEEQQRSGGSGVYYHLSYWGRPHDYLWLSTTQPALIWYEMSKAYQNGAQKIWIVNVGDIKPAEYNMEFFLDLAWDINRLNENQIENHLYGWAAREFGAQNAEEIAAVMNEYYRLAFLRKPEFMGWSRTEPSTSTGPTEFSQTANNNELQRRIDQYRALYIKTESLKKNIASERLDAYFQLVEYPVKGATLMNEKFLYAQQAHLIPNIEEKKKLAKKSQNAFDEIVVLTNYYNNEMSYGKWKGMMNYQPRGLAAFQMPNYHLQESVIKTFVENISENVSPIFIRANQFSASQGTDNYQWSVINGLGYSSSAITLLPLKSAVFDEEKPTVTYLFNIDHPGKYFIEVRCLPTHSNNFDQELGISIDKNPLERFSLNTQGRSDEWKNNVLRNFAQVRCPVFFENDGKHQLTIEVNQTGIVIDQIAIIYEAHEPFYEIPKNVIVN